MSVDRSTTVTPGRADVPMPAPLHLWRDERPLPDWVQAAGRGLRRRRSRRRHHRPVSGHRVPEPGPRRRVPRLPHREHPCERPLPSLGRSPARSHSRTSTSSTVLSFAKVQAQLRIPQKSMQRSYRVSFFTMWEAWSAHLRQIIVGPRRRPRRGRLGSAAAHPDDPGLSGLRRLAGRRDVHPRLRGAQPVSGTHASQPGQGHPARRERGAVRLRCGDPVLRPDRAATSPCCCRPSPRARPPSWRSACAPRSVASMRSSTR